MIKVISSVPVYERNGKEANWQTERIEIQGHWNEQRKIIIKIGDETYTVIASDLEAAIKNATHTNRY